MTCQNLAVCFGPVLLSQRQEASCHTNRVFIDSEELASALHFKKHIEVLHYLLQLWPGEGMLYLFFCCCFFVNKCKTKLHFGMLNKILPGIFVLVHILFCIQITCISKWV